MKKKTRGKKSRATVPLKGQQREIFLLWLCHQSTPFGFLLLNFLRILFRIRRVVRIRNLLGHCGKLTFFLQRPGIQNQGVCISPGYYCFLYIQFQHRCLFIRCSKCIAGGCIGYIRLPQSQKQCIYVLLFCVGKKFLAVRRVGLMTHREYRVDRPFPVT